MTSLKLTLAAAIASALAFSAPAHADTFKYRVSAPGVRAAPAGIATGTLVALGATNFGSVPVGQSAALQFRFTNVGDATARNLQAVVGGSDLQVQSSTCGVAGATVSLGAGQSCDVAVAYSPQSVSPMTGTVSVAGGYSNSPLVLNLSGQGAGGAIGTLTANTTPDFGSVALNGSATRSFTFSNTGNQAATGTYATLPDVVGLTLVSNTCGTAASPVTVAANSSCAISLSFGGSTASRMVNANLSLAGAFTGSPASLALAGTLGGITSTGTWSSSYSANTAPTSAFVAIGTKTTNTTTVKSIYLRNVGSSGAMSAGFSLVGDTAHFKITGISAFSSAGQTNACRSGGVISADGTMATSCLTDAVGTTFSAIRVSLTYLPTEVGNHSVTVIPTSNNGTALPDALAFSATGQFNPTGVWSSSISSVVAHTPTTLSFGSRALNSNTNKAVYLRNTGSNGELFVGYALTGDTAHFRISQVQLTNASNQGACLAGGVVSGDSLSTTPCKAEDLAGGYRPTMQLVLVYSPKSSGAHSITLTPSTTNGTALPNALTFTGAGL